MLEPEGLVPNHLFQGFTKLHISYGQKRKRKNKTFEHNLTLADLDTGAWWLLEGRSQQVTRQVCGEHPR